VPISEYLADVLLFDAVTAGSIVYFFCISLVCTTSRGLYDFTSLSNSKSIKFYIFLAGNTLAVEISVFCF